MEDTPFPTASEPCYVCGDPSLTVQPDLTTMLGDDEFSCGDLELAGLLRLFGSDTCPALQILVTSDCNCGTEQLPAPAPTPAPSLSPTVDTPYPTASEPCYVCGDPSLTVQRDLTTMLGDDEFSCRDLELAGQLRLFGSDTCPALQILVTSDCGCAPDGPTVAPLSSPTTPDTPAPTYSDGDAPPTPRGPPATEAPVKIVVEESSGGGAALYALAALALLPIAAGLFVYFKRKNTADESNKQSPVQNPVAPAVEGSGPSGPSAPAAPAPYQPSVTASLQTDDEYYNRPPPVAVASAVSQSTVSGWSGTASIPSHASAGSGQSHDPPASPGGQTAPYASPPADARDSGDYLPDVKDQCRSVRAERVGAEAIVVSNAVPVASKDDDRKRAPLEP